MALNYTKAESLEKRVNTLVGSNYADTVELNQYLLDGVKDIVHRIAKLDSNKLELFSITENLSNSNGLDLESGLLIYVRRDTGNKIAGTSTADVRSANKIPLGLKEKVQDHNSLHYRSKYAPVYYLENIGNYPKVFVLPEPSLAEPAHINYVKFSNEGGTKKGSGWYPLNASEHNSIRYFPDKYSYHLVLYAAMRAIDAKIAVSGTAEEDFELMQALQALKAQFRNEYDSLFLIGAGQEQPAAPQGRGREARG